MILTSPNVKFISRLTILLAFSTENINIKGNKNRKITGINLPSIFYSTFDICPSLCNSRCQIIGLGT